MFVQHQGGSSNVDQVSGHHISRSRNTLIYRAEKNNGKCLKSIDVFLCSETVAIFKNDLQKLHNYRVGHNLSSGPNNTHRYSSDDI